MAQLVDFFTQHKRLFYAQKHENLRKTEKFKDTVLLKFLSFCESRNLFHTDAIRKKHATLFFNTAEMLALSPETRRKYFLVLREFYQRFLKSSIEIKSL